MIIKTTFNKFLVALLTAFLLLNCCSQNYSSSKFFGCLSGHSSSSLPENEVARKPKLVAVLLHGMGMNNSQFKTIKKELIKLFGTRLDLNQYFDNQLEFIEPTCREGKSSIIYPLAHLWIPNLFKCLRKWVFPTQTNGVIQEINDELKRNHIYPHKDHLFIIGISQGGQLAHIVSDHYPELTNQGGVISINSPLGSVDALQNKKSDIAQFISNGESGLKAIGCDDEDVKIIERNLCKDLLQSKFAPGVVSMSSNSSCIKQLPHCISNNVTPRLLIGSYVEDLFNKIIDQKEYPDLKDYSYHPVSLTQHPGVAKLNEALARLITRKEAGYHDGLIATSSQLLIEDADIKSMPKDTMQRDTKNKNLYRVLLRNATHCCSIQIPSRTGILIDTTKTPVIDYDSRVSEQIVNFINKIVMIDKE